MDRFKGWTAEALTEVVQWGGWATRFRYEADYLGNWPTIVTEFLEGWEWVVWPYTTRTASNSEEFDASAGSFNISTSHTLSSSIQNMYVKNNINNELYFPVWQHYWSNSATQRVFEDEETVMLQTKDLLWTPVDLEGLQSADTWSSSTFESTFHIMENAPRGIILEGWQGGVAAWKAHWRHKFPENMIPWEVTVKYKRPIEISAGDDFYFKVTNIDTGLTVKVATWVEAPWFPWISSRRKKYSDKQIALKQEAWLLENVLATENGWDTINTPVDNEMILWTDWQYIEWN